ncbi:hypothetical protein ACIQ9P_03660 [Kitasatospora sp. NPDC094019]|uniref:hypothetical protein n=1 Tax=Kitasatospora sp. NPDC094019 TaxID=3364091 RepID=UPI00382288EF
MLLRLIAATVLIAPIPIVDQPTGWRVAIHVEASAMTIARVTPEPLCADASNALTERLLAQGFESYGVIAPTRAAAAARVQHLYDTDAEPAPGEYPPAETC